jgi:hypothetical protein
MADDRVDPVRLRDELARDLRRVAERLRGLSEPRLAAAAPPHESRAAAARATAQALADAAQGLEERAQPDEPAWRQLPELPDLALGDQLSVTGHDLLAAAIDASADDPAWARGRRRTAGDVLTAAAAHLGDLRRLL